MNSYAEFIKQKTMIDPPTGMVSVPELNSCLRDYQKDMVRWALRRGRAAFFADCGLGKGPMQMEFASRQPHECIIAAPLAVAHQFVREAEKFGFDLAYAKDQSEVTKRITVTNFERHVCQMALDLIERAIHLWSNPGDVVFDPYSGIGSTGFMAISTGRKFVGSELKTAYFKQAAKNISSAKARQGSLFDMEDAA